MNKQLLQLELRKAFQAMKIEWQKQSNHNDYKTNFIYTVNSFEELKEQCLVNDCDINYAIHRWYNYKTSKICEEMLIEKGGKANSDEKNKYIDLYFNEVPYDLKLTVFPKGYKDFNLLKTRIEKNSLIKWLYRNQSTQQRFHLANRLFIVCIDKNNNYREAMRLKSDFSLLEEKIHNFYEYFKSNPLNEITLNKNKELISVYSDIIAVSNEDK